MWESAKEFGRELLRWWWIVVIGVGGGSISFMQTFISAPIWTSIAILLAGPFVASFLAFHKVRVQRDKLRAQLNNEPIRDAILRIVGEAIADADLIQRVLNKGYSQEYIRQHWEGKIIEWIGNTYEKLLNVSSRWANFFADAPDPAPDTPSGADLRKLMDARLINLRQIESRVSQTQNMGS